MTNPTAVPPENPAPAALPPAGNDAVTTPAMRQYIEQKAAVPDAILFFRMGDFYETFYDDARTISRELGIALTARSKGDNPIPLAGVPYHAVDGYVARLVRAGYKVAVSEQMEDAKEAKGVVRREIVRIITPGTLTEDSLLEERADNWLAALCFTEKNRRARNATANAGESRPAAAERVGLACIELASGRFFAQMLPAGAVLDELARLAPAEVLLAEQPIDARDPWPARLCDSLGVAVTLRAANGFSTHNARAILLNQLGVASLEGFGFDAFDASLCAAGALIDYLRETQKSALGHVLSISPRSSDDHLAIDQATLRSLEVERTLRGGERRGSLLDALDRTVNPMGARRLREWLCFPLRDAPTIRRRQQAIADLRQDTTRLARLRTLLADVGDVERITSRLGVGRVTPRDLAALGRGLKQLVGLRDAIGAAVAPTNTGPDLLTELAASLAGLDDLAADLSKALRDDAPPVARDGGFIASGYNAELDRLRSLGSDGQRWLAEYQAAESVRTGIPSLKVGYNQVFGYYIEITHTYRDKAPPEYVRKQTVRNAERYISEPLKRFETDSLSSRERAVRLEIELFDEIRLRALRDVARLQSAASALASLDVLAGLAELSLERRYCRPELVEAGQQAKQKRGGLMEIVDGRHPVLDQTLGSRFVPNDCRLAPDADRLLIITGPNMAGKSTYIRQTALLVLLAQTGSWVPAASMRWSPADRLFARVGASDELGRGQSTFMVEMVETARILHHASPDSVVILDEIGRGTSTFDGLALAWAITEHLVGRIGCRTLFATHYHELTELAEVRRGVANYNVAVREQPRPDGGGEEVIFLHRIVPGGTDKSYGVHVARMAGIPLSVVARSREVLAELEQGFAGPSRREQADAGVGNTPTLFPPAPPPPAWWEALSAELSRINIDDTTPLDALTILRDLQARLREN